MTRRMNSTGKHKAVATLSANTYHPRLHFLRVRGNVVVSADLGSWIRRLYLTQRLCQLCLLLLAAMHDLSAPTL